MIFSKNCPKCNELQYFKSKYTLKISEKNNALCKKCYRKGEKNPMFGRKHKNESLEKMYVAFDKNRGSGIYSNKGEKNGMFNVKGVNHPTTNRFHTDEEKIKMKIPRSEDFKRKLRIATQKRIQNMGGGTNYNKFSCVFFKLLNEKNNWNGLYAENDKEYNILGYSVDYYEPKLNLVIEWDEEAHYVGNKLKDKDLKRQHNISEYLKCRFIRIRQKDVINLSVDEICQKYL